LGRFQLRVYLQKFGGTIGDLFLQVFAVLLEFEVAPLDLLEHAVELTGQQPEFVVAQHLGTDRVVAPSGNALGGFYQIKDGPRYWFYKARRQHKSQTEGAQQSEQESKEIAPQAGAQLSQIGFKIECSDGFARKHDSPELHQMAVLKAGALGLRQARNGTR